MSTKPGECDSATIEENEGNVQQGTCYQPVFNVLITGRDPSTNKVTISVIGTDENRHEHDLTWGDESKMWVYCPSSLPSDAIYPEPGEVPALETTGTLYLEKDFVSNNAISGGTPKWPRCFDETPRSAKLRIAPTSLKLKGIELAQNDETVEATVDLMDPAIAPRQTITIGDGAITVRLTREGFNAFNVLFPSSQHLADAVRTILERRDPRQISLAWEIVADCEEMLRMDEWPDDASAGLAPDHARRLIKEVFDGAMKH